MSKTIDQRVVEMQFDNRQFESNVRTSMSTLDKLKQSLNFKGAAKGFEEISSSAKKVDMNSLAKSVDAVKVQFSSLQVIATTALANITNSAINAGKNIVSSFTLDPIISGFQEYETQMNAIQTIMANTQSKGTTLEEVKNALAELNTYADMTIYNFTEMTRNIGTFTAAGVDLDKSVTSIKGIANLAAVSGSNSQQAATAMYQLSQALAAGKVQLMDWNSVVNAGMGGELFQNALIRTATQMGTNVDALIEKYGSFRESLTKGEWLTAEVLTETLTQLSGAYTEADLIAQGYTESQAKEIVELAETAVNAATKVKTFTQLIDTMKEAVGSGWAQTWQLIIGDFEEAKELWTGISEFFTGDNGIITKMSNARNAMLEGALMDNPFSKLKERIESVTGATEKMTKATTDYSAVVNKVIRGDFGNGQARLEALTKAGYDYATVQNLVNEKLGSSYRHATNYKEAQEDLSKTQKATIEDLVKMSDAQLTSLGFTKDEIEAFRELEEQSKKTGIPINDLIKDLDQLNGRTLLINSFKNAAQGLVAIFTSISDGWRKAFYGDASEEDILQQKTERLYNMIAALHKFSQNLVVSDETADKLTRTFQGLFAIVDMVSTLVGGGFKLAFTVVSKVLGAFDLSILDVTANIGDAIVAFRDWVDEHNFLAKGIDAIIPPIKNAIEAIGSWVDSLKNSENLPRDIASGIMNGFGSALKFVKNVIDQLIDLVTGGFSEIPEGISSGLVGGLQNGMKIIGDTLIELGHLILDKIKGVLGIHSPSTEFFAIGENIIAGLVNGIQSGLSALWDVIQGIGSQIISIVGQIDWGTVFAALLSAGGMIVLYKFASALSSLTAPLEGLGDVFEGAGNVLDAFAGTIKSFNFKMKAEAIKTFAIAIAILAGSVAVLAMIPAAQLWNAVGVIAALSAVIAGLSIAIDKFGNGKMIDAAKIGGLLLALSTSFLLLAGTMKILSGMTWDDLTKASAGLMALGMVVTSLIAATKLGGKGLDKAGSTILKISVAMGALVLVGKLIAGMEWSDMAKAGAGLGGLTVIVGGLIAVTKLAGNNIDKVGGTILKLSIAMAALVLVSKLIAGMSWDDMGKAAVGLSGLSAIVALLIAITKLAGNDADKIGGTILKISIAMAALVVVSKLISGMSWEDMGKAAVGLAGLSAIVAILIGITKLASEKDLARLGTTLLMMSASIGILGGISVLLGLVKTENLIKGVTAVGVLSLLMSAMIVATKFANGSTGNLVVLTVAIGILAASAAALSFIDPSKLMTATAALSVLMGMFALMAKASGSAQTALGAMVTMTLVVGALAGILYLLSGLPVESTLAVATSLSMILLALSTSMMIISKAGAVAPTALVALGIMTLIAGGIGAILVLLSQMNPGPTLEIATSLSVLLLSLSAVCLILSAVGATGPAALVGVGIFSAVVLAIGGLMAGIGALISYFPQLETFVTTGIDLLNKVAYGIGSFIGNLVGGFASGITSGLPDIGTNLSAFMTNAQGFIDGASGIDPAAFDGIGSLVGAIVMLTAANVLEAISSWLTGGSSLSDFAEELVPFGESMVEFSNSLKGMDSNLVANAATAGKTLAEMAATIPNSGGIVGKIFGENDMSEFGEQLVDFGEAMVKYSKAVAGLDANAVVNSTIAGKALTELANTVPNSGGLAGFFAGENDMDDFGAQLVPFGKAMKNYSLAVAGLDSEAIVNSATAGKALTELADTVPNTGGLVAFFTGDNDLETFGTQLEAFGSSMMAYSNAVAGINEEAITASASAGAMLVALADTVPNTGGLVAFFAGDNDLETFGEQLVSFGWSMSSYSFAVSAIDVEAITRSVTAAQQLSDLASSLENSGGLVSFFAGDNDLGAFGKSLQEFGQALVNYSDSVSMLDTGALSSVITQVYRLISMAERTNGLDTSGMSSFGKGLKEMAKADIDGLVSIYTNSYDRVKSAVQGLVDALSAGVSTYQSTFVTSVSTMINEALSAISSKSSEFNTNGGNLVTSFATGAQSKNPDGIRVFEELIRSILEMIGQNGTNFNDAGSNLVEEFVSGIKSEEKTASRSFDSVLTSMLTSIRSEYTGFYNAAKYLVQGFANGITENTYLARAQAQAMAQAAKTSAEATLGVHSPSKVFYTIGIFVVEGFANGIKENTSEVEEAAEVLGDSVTESTEKALDVKGGTSELAKKVIGETFVNGIAEGITEDMSAEEAAEKKAENIVTAFANALEKVDLSSSTVGLKEQIWDALSENIVSESQGDAAKLQLMLKDYEYQTQRLELAKAEYQTMVEQFGEQSEQAQESYNKLLQEQLDTINLFNDIADLKAEQAEREKDAYEKRAEQLESEYNILEKGYSKNLTQAENNLFELALLTDKYELYTKKADSARANYDSMVRAFGENSTKALEAYDAYLEAYEEQTNLAAELESSRKDQLDYGSSSYKRVIDYLKAQREEMLLAQGIGEEEASKQVSDEFKNFNPAKDLSSLIDSVREMVQSSAEDTAESSSVAYKETVAQTFGPMVEDFENYGESYAEALNKGFESSAKAPELEAVTVIGDASSVDSSGVASQLEAAISSIASDSEGMTQTVTTTFGDLGQTAISGFITGMQTELTNVGDLSGALSGMLENITEEMQNVLGGDTFSAEGQIDTEAAPEMAKPLLTFFQTLAEYIRVLFSETYQETWFDVGNQIIIFIVNGIEDAIPEMENIVQVFMNNFLNAVLWFESMFYQAGQTLVLSILYGFKSEEYRFIQYANELGVTVGSAMVAGFESGMASARSYIAKTGNTMVTTVVNAAMSAMDAHSPSRLFMKIGSYVPLGFAIGIRDNEGVVAKSAIDMTRNTIARVAETIENGIDPEPTIRPVIDLSNVETGAKRLNAMFSRNRALSIDRNMPQSTIESSSQNGETASETGSTINFTQNNYSPKALSRVEIYRQTKNQISTLKRMVRV